MIQHRNNIGFLRLVFASLVIVGHAPEQIDGDRHREPLTAIFHSISLGEFCVDGFFLISGYLITQSMIRTRRYGPYFERRIMRIWPGYLVTCLLCTFALAPLVGGHPMAQGVKALLRMLLLGGPVDTPGQLPGLHVHALNGAMWTILLEFGCYVMIAVLAFVRVLERPRIMAGLAIAALAIVTLGTFTAVHQAETHLAHQGLVFFLLGDPMRLAGFFLAGAVAFLHRDFLVSRLDGKIAAAAVIIAAISLLSAHTAQFGLAIAGGAALFWLALKADLGMLQPINDQWDISYGTYLYGWPIAVALLYFGHLTSPLVLMAWTLPIALSAGTASWWLVEKWTKDFFRSRTERPQPPAA